MRSRLLKKATASTAKARLQDEQRVVFISGRNTAVTGGFTGPSTCRSVSTQRRMSPFSPPGVLVTENACLCAGVERKHRFAHRACFWADRRRARARFSTHLLSICRLLVAAVVLSVPLWSFLCLSDPFCASSSLDFSCVFFALSFPGISRHLGVSGHLWASLSISGLLWSFLCLSG